MDADIFGRTFYLLLLLVAITGWVMIEYRQRVGLAVRSALAWGLIFLGVIAAYGLWSDIRRDVIPQQSVSQNGQIILPRAPDGHFYAELEVNGTPVLFMVDTGATSMVLSRRDAARLGIDLNNLAYTGYAQTANGRVRTARVALNQVMFGPFTDDRVSAYVNDGNLDASLLGMDYLRRYSIGIEGDRMILTR